MHNDKSAFTLLSDHVTDVGMILLVFVGIVSSSAHATSFSPREDIIQPPSGQEGATYVYYHFNETAYNVLKAETPVQLHKVFLNSIDPGQEVYVGHVASSGCLAEVKGIFNDISMHPLSSDVDTNEAYIGDPGKDCDSPQQPDCDINGYIHRYSIRVSGEGTCETTDRTQWRSTDFGWHYFFLPVEDNGNQLNDAKVMYPFETDSEVQISIPVYLFHVTTSSMHPDHQPLTPPIQHKDLHWFNNVPTLTSYPNRVYLYMFGFRRGHFSFTVTQGQDKVDLISVYDSSVRGDSITYDIDTEGGYVKVIVQSTAPSSSINDITIECKWGESAADAVKIIDYHTTVWSPIMYSIDVLDSTSTGDRYGYRSVHMYHVVPSLIRQSFNIIPEGLWYSALLCNEEYKEYWTDARWDPSGVAGWTIMQTNAETDLYGRLIDIHTTTNMKLPHPQPVVSEDWTPVMGFKHHLWRAGTHLTFGGVELETPKSLTFYLGCARRE